MMMIVTVIGNNNFLHELKNLYTPSFFLFFFSLFFSFIYIHNMSSVVTEEHVQYCSKVLIAHLKKEPYPEPIFKNDR